MAKILYSSTDVSDTEKIFENINFYFNSYKKTKIDIFELQKLMHQSRVFLDQANRNRIIKEPPAESKKPFLIGGMIVFVRKCVRKIFRWYFNDIARQSMEINSTFVSVLNKNFEILNFYHDNIIRCDEQ